MRIHFLFSLLLVFGLSMENVSAQGTISRPPAIPLMTADPYFSVWSFTDNPAQGYTRHWTGSTMGICLMIKIDGKSYRVVGKNERSLPALNLKQTIVAPTQTIYTFDEAGIELRLIFTAPLLPDSLDLISEDASYITWKVRSVDGARHHVYLYFDGDAEFCLSNPGQRVAWGRLQLPGLDVMKMGSQRQPVLEEKGDRVKIGWGYVYFCSPKDQKPESVLAPADAAREAFIERSSLPTADDFNTPSRGDSDWPAAALCLRSGTREVARMFH